MPVEAKPLFRPDVVRMHLAAFSLPSRIEPLRRQLADWASLLSTGRANQFKEQELLPEFLTVYFHGVLGYTGPAENPDRYTMSREHHVQVDGKFADAVLGEFNGTPRYVAALEGKGPKDPLDRPFGGRRMSAVDQGYRYAINLPCDWVIVTSIRQIRLYYKGCDQHTYERFDVERMADDDKHLERFVFLLGAERVAPTAGPCHLTTLLGESERVGRDLTKEFYLRYAEMRQDAFERLCRDNPDVSRHEVLSSTQKLLDRVLFCAFCEDRGLLPVDTIQKAYEHRDPYHPRPIWENFRGLFAAVNGGNAGLGIHAYNGGLFAEDPLLDRLQVADAVCGYFRDLGSYDYRPAAQAASSGSGSSLIDVDILGHIFEQSISDLERLRNQLDGLTEPVGADKHTTRRKKEGAFYTPAFITRYIIEQALGGVLRDRFEQLRQRHAREAKGTARAALVDPGVYELEKLKAPQRAALVRFWEAWQDELASVRLLDPACGSGAFLIEAFDQLHTAYQASNDRLQELRGHRSLFDLDRRILEHNLYGVDLNDEAIEICRLSLWIKTAQRGKPLASLDHPIRVGNSVVADSAVHPKAFDWQNAFPEVFGQGGFDVVVGNPPYVRQELLSLIKPYLQAAYRAYHGMADLYVYFYELGLRVLKPGGLLSFVVTNKWMKAGYGEPLRRFFAEEAWIESVVDFGHAKQIFEDADVFPSIVVARRPTDTPKPTTARLCAIPREQLRIDDLSQQIEQQGTELPIEQLGHDAWQLEGAEVSELLAKLRSEHPPLAEFVRAKPSCGILTGYNDAFVIDRATRDILISADPQCDSVIKPYMRGQDVNRWTADWAGLWLIVLKSSADFTWSWSNAGEDAEAVFGTTYPSIYARMKATEPRLRSRQHKGRHWWELRSCKYWDDFDLPKLLYQVIQFHSCYAIDSKGTYGNDKTFFIPTDDLYVLGVLNSALLWWHNWRYLPHMKDEALCPVAFLMESVPIAQPSERIRGMIESAVRQTLDITADKQTTCRTILDWLRVEYEIEKPTLKLQSPIGLDCDGFVAEVRKIRGKKKPLTAAGLKALRDEYARTIEPARRLAAEAMQLEYEINDLVNAAYGLTPEEIALMWDTAPPRMPLPGPGKASAT
ncbi:MAG: Eco57I restriction-modification methylase domain-containing protein [Pirellulaceae bacterium]|nr:Eco57I restriction-modification methylase domain-containing protein [Pirellulaceae bacterium]